MTEVRETSRTGGQKGRKPERASLLPVEELFEVMRLYHEGAKKYDDHNWRKGYPYSWSYDALVRHVMLFWNGEDTDEETKCHHLASAIFHALALMYFQNAGIGEDDRPKKFSADVSTMQHGNVVDSSNVAMPEVQIQDRVLRRGNESDSSSPPIKEYKEIADWAPTTKLAEHDPLLRDVGRPYRDGKPV